MLKETIKSAKKHPVLWLFVTMLLCGVNYADAQEFNNSGTYSVGGVANAQGVPATAKRGVVRMKGTGTENGAINGIGASEATRIPGTVIWAKKAEQNVQALSYTNLGVEGNGAKKIFGTTNTTVPGPAVTVPSAGLTYRISNNFLRFEETAQATPIGRFAVTDVDWNEANYPNIKHFCDAYVIYDGGHDQAILGSFKASSAGGDNDNEYAYVEKAGTGNAILYTPVRTGTWTNSANGATQIVNGATTGYGRLDIVAIFCEAFPPTDDDSLIVTPDPPPGPDPDPDPDDTTTPPPGPPDDPDDPRNVACKITIGPGIVMNVGQSLYFLDDSKNVITSAAASPLCVTAGVASGTDVFSEKPGKVIYHGDAHTIAPARRAETWKGYGILQIESNVGIGGEVLVAGPTSYALTVVDGGGINTLNDNYDGTGTLTGMDDTYRRITLVDPNANIAYATTGTEDITAPSGTGCAEIMGWIFRTAQSETAPASVTGKKYIFHNNATDLMFATLATEGNIDNFGMLMTNSETPNYYSQVGAANWTANWNSKAEVLDPTNKPGIGYIDRLWQVDYNGTGGSIENVNLAFVADEIPNIFGYQAGQDGWKQYVRGYEAYLTGGNNTLTTLVGQNGNDPNKWAFSESAACNYVLATQQYPISLNGSDAPGGDQSAAWDMAKGSQFVFGNQPLIFTSIRNGRWSDPGTWDKATTPTAQDNVNITYLIYTGYYDKATASTNSSFLNARQWPVNEYDLPSVTSANGFAVLADSVNILPVNPTGVGAAKTGPSVALIIGSEETDGNKTEGNADAEVAPGTAMNFDIPLLFGVITNKAIATNEASNHNLTRAKLQANYTSNGISGLWITSGPAATDKSAIINPKTLNNEGTFVNEAILEVGHDE